MKQNLTEKKRCKFNSGIEMCLYGHNWMVIQQDMVTNILSLVSTCIIYIESRVKIQNSVFRLFAYYKLNYLEYIEGQNSKF